VRELADLDYQLGSSWHGTESVAELLFWAAREHPVVEARYFQDGSTNEPTVETYAGLLDSAQSTLNGLFDEGLRQGDKVLLVLESAQEFIHCFWACVLGGLIPCALPTPRGSSEQVANQIERIHQLLDGPVIVAGDSIATTLPDVPGVKVLRIGNLSGQSGTPITYQAARDDLAALVLTSGSTGTPKAVRLTHGNLLASMQGKNRFQRLTAADVTMNWISFDHVAALLECHMLPLSSGAAQLHIAPAVIVEQPLEFLRFVSKYRVTMTFTPNFLLGQLNAAAGGVREGELDLASLRHIISGGEAVVSDTSRAFLENYARHGLGPATLWPTFGMTETCAGSIYSLDFPRHDHGQEFANVGHPIDGLQLRIVGEDGRPVGDGEVGELQLTGPIMTTGYYQNDEATEAAFTADGWFRSGDLGRLDDGRLTLVGRSKDSVIVNGVSYFSQDIEAVLEQLDGVTPTYVAAFPTRRPGGDTEQLAIAFLPQRSDDAALFHTLSAIRSTVVMHCGFRPAVILPLTRAELPKTSLGKLQRTQLRRRLEAGEFDDALVKTAELTRAQLGGYVPPEGPVEEAIAEIYRDLFDADEVSATANFFDLGGTSLDILRMRNILAKRFDLPDLEIITVLTVPTVRQMARYVTEIRQRPEKAYDPIVTMQESGPGTPLFCVHPGVGEVLVFVNLAKYFIGERPFYALRARGFNRGEEPFGSFREMVDSYVDAIRRKQPHGPYAIAGYSYGGVVAFEIAKVLEASGERVAFVGSFNLPPHIKYRMDEMDFLETVVTLAFFLGLIDKNHADRLPGELRGSPEDELVNQVLALSSADRMAELDINLEKFSAWAKIAHSIILLGRTYLPSGRIRSMTVFCANPLRGTKEDWINNELHRWDEHTTEPNRYVEVPGEHYTLMSPQHVPAFQAILRAELDRALSGT